MEDLWKRLGTNLAHSFVYHTQIDRKTKVVNRFLGNLLRYLTKKYSQSWDTILPQEEFSFNESINRSTGKTLFQVVYGLQPKGPLDLTKLPSDFKISAHGQELVVLITKVHQQVKETLQKYSLK